ncbi:hypothetical protein D3C73_902070 [compost metagenome]
MEADAALGRAAGVVIATAPGQEGFARAVVHADQQADLHRLARIFQLFKHIAVDLDMPGGLVEAGQGRVEDIRIGHFYSKAGWRGPASQQETGKHPGRDRNLLP